MLAPNSHGKIYKKKFDNVYPNLSEKYNLPLIPFLLKDVALKPDLNLNDGIHPNKKGTKIISNTIKNKILDKEFKWNKPLILIQGLKDNVVTPDVPEKIVKKIKGKQIQIKLLKNSDHRLSDPFDLKIMNDSIQSIIN